MCAVHGRIAAKQKGPPYSGKPFLLPSRSDGKSAECARAAATVQSIQSDDPRQVEALAEGGPKGPPMIAWHDLDDREAAAVRADLGRWVGEVLFPLYPAPGS